MTGLWLLPTKGRPHQIARFFEAWRKTAANTPGWLLVDEDDPSDYSAVALPENWSIVRGTSSCVADAVNTAWVVGGLKNGEVVDWIGLLCDDHIPQTMEWDRLLIERVKPYNIVASANGSQEKRLHGALLYGGKLLNAVGWIYPPGIKHSFHDDAWELVAERCLNLIKCDDVMVRHAHAGTVDETGRKRNTYWNEDERAYLRWRSTGANETIKKVTALMESCGVQTKAPDLSDKSLLIMSPNYSGAYERVFMFSLQKTLDLLRALNIKVTFEDCPHVAEPGFARALMFGRFYRSTYSHLLTIDDDMGWDARVVLRMMSANQDLIAVAGPRKIDTPAVAAHVTREDSQATFYEEKTGAMSVTEVGAAFTMITRSCAEKMVKAYPELEFDTAHGATEYDLYQNVIVPREGRRVRLSEDYSFCWRARQAGIRTMVLPDVTLDHVGKRTWRCSLNDVVQSFNLREAAD